MFPLVVVFGNVHGNFGLGHSGPVSAGKIRAGNIRSGAEQNRAEGEAGYVFQNIGVLDSFRYSFAPGKRSVAGNQDTGDGEGVEVSRAKAADNDSTRIADVGLGDLFGGEELGDRNGAVKVVGVGCAEAGNGAAGLGPGGCEFGMSVDDAADPGEFTVEIRVRIEVA